MVIRNVHRLSCILLTCPARVHFRLLTCSTMSVTFVFSLIKMFFVLSLYVIFNVTNYMPRKDIGMEYVHDWNANEDEYNKRSVFSFAGCKYNKSYTKYSFRRQE